MRILAHRPVEELDLTACGGDLLEQDDLMHIVAREPVRCGDQNPIEFAQSRTVAQPLQTWPGELGAAIAIIAEDVLRGDAPALLKGVSLQAINLLSEAVSLRPALGGDPLRDRFGMTSAWQPGVRAGTEEPAMGDREARPGRVVDADRAAAATAQAPPLSASGSPASR